MVNNYSWDLDTTYIKHSGVKGMHWYQRRYQNEDGSLTPAGRIRYQKSLIKADRLQTKSAKHRNRAIQYDKTAAQYKEKALKNKSHFLQTDLSIGWTNHLEKKSAQYWVKKTRMNDLSNRESNKSQKIISNLKDKYGEANISDFDESTVALAKKYGIELKEGK